MSDLNILVIEGHLTKSASIGFWGDGTPYCSFSIGNNESYKKSNGEYENIPSFFDCIIKGNYANSIGPKLIKGRGIRIVGRLKQSRWEKDGQKFSKVVIKVHEVKLSPVANPEQQQPPAQQQQSYQDVAPIPDEELDFVPFDTGKDIPF